MVEKTYNDEHCNVDVNIQEKRRNGWAEVHGKPDFRPMGGDADNIRRDQGVCYLVFHVFHANDI